VKQALTDGHRATFGKGAAALNELRAAQQQVAADEAGASVGASLLNLVFDGRHRHRHGPTEPLT
jgi:hypothetical protein